MTEPEDFGIFYNSTDVDFQHGVQDAVMNVGQYTRSIYYFYDAIFFRNF